jgi:hypothetical protein
MGDKMTERRHILTTEILNKPDSPWSGILSQDAFERILIEAGHNLENVPPTLRFGYCWGIYRYVLHVGEPMYLPSGETSWLHLSNQSEVPSEAQLTEVWASVHKLRTAIQKLPPGVRKWIAIPNANVKSISADDAVQDNLPPDYGIAHINGQPHSVSVHPDGYLKHVEWAVDSFQVKRHRGGQPSTIRDYAFSIAAGLYWLTFEKVPSYGGNSPTVKFYDALDVVARPFLEYECVGPAAAGEDLVAATLLINAPRCAKCSDDRHRPRTALPMLPPLQTIIGFPACTVEAGVAKILPSCRLQRAGPYEISGQQIRQTPLCLGVHQKWL